MKILASDFDNTLYIDNDELFNKNVEYINKFIKMGNTFILITGRSYFDIKPLLIENNINYTYLICEDGAKIYNSNDYCISSINIDSSSVEKIISITNKYNMKCLLDDGYNYTENIFDCVKIDILYDEWDRAVSLLKEIKDNVRVYGYISRHYINITSNDVNKSNSLVKLCNIEGFNVNGIIVIGDDINDYEMIKNFNGYMVSNHASVLDSLNRPNFDYLYLLIEELLIK